MFLPNSLPSCFQNTAATNPVAVENAQMQSTLEVEAGNW
jgi:hypothetical protein